jgi:hypothetical protein
MRHLSTPLALVALGLSTLAGAGAGLAGHTVAAGHPAPGRASSSTGAPTGSPTGSSTGSAAPRFLGSANLLAARDFEAIRWHGVRVEGEGNGEPQFAYACQRRALAASSPTGTISATWNLHGSFTAAETVAELPSPPQARGLFTRLARWYEQCTPGAPGSGPVTPTELLDTVQTAHGTAQVWRVGTDGRRPTYGVVARGRLRIGLVDLYGDATPPDPAGLSGLARDAIDRLG